MHILATLQHNGAQTQFNQSESREETARTGTHHNDLWTLTHILIVHPFKLILRGQFVHIDTHLQVHEDGSLTGVNRALQDAHSLQCAQGQSLFLGDIFP